MEIRLLDYTYTSSSVQEKATQSFKGMKRPPVRSPYERNDKISDPTFLSSELVLAKGLDEKTVLERIQMYRGHVATLSEYGLQQLNDPDATYGDGVAWCEGCIFDDWFGVRVVTPDSGSKVFIPFKNFEDFKNLSVELSKKYIERYLTQIGKFRLKHLLSMPTNILGLLVSKDISQSAQVHIRTQLRAMEIVSSIEAGESTFIEKPLLQSDITSSSLPFLAKNTEFLKYAPPFMLELTGDKTIIEKSIELRPSLEALGLKPNRGKTLYAWTTTLKSTISYALGSSVVIEILKTESKILPPMLVISRNTVNDADSHRGFNKEGQRLVKESISGNPNILLKRLLGNSDQLLKEAQKLNTAFSTKTSVIKNKDSDTNINTHPVYGELLPLLYDITREAHSPSVDIKTLAYRLDWISMLLRENILGQQVAPINPSTNVTNTGFLDPTYLKNRVRTGRGATTLRWVINAPIMQTLLLVANCYSNGDCMQYQTDIYEGLTNLRNLYSDQDWGVVVEGLTSFQSIRNTVIKSFDIFEDAILIEPTIAEWKLSEILDIKNSERIVVDTNPHKAIIDSLLNTK